MSVTINCVVTKVHGQIFTNIQYNVLMCTSIDIHTQHVWCELPLISPYFLVWFPTKFP